MQEHTGSGVHYQLQVREGQVLKRWVRVVQYMYAVLKPVLPYVAWMRPENYNKNLDKSQFQFDKMNDVP